MKGARRSKRILVSVTMAVVSLIAVVLVAALSGPAWKAAYDAHMAYLVTDLQELVDRYEAQVSQFLPVIPPELTSCLQPFAPVLQPFEPRDFPAEFLDGLVAADLDGVPVYPISVLEDPDTGAAVFLNADREQIAVVPAAEGHDRYWYVRQEYPELFQPDGPGEAQLLEDLMALFDPCRMELHCLLVEPKDLLTYLKTQSALPPGGVVPLSMGEGSESNLVFADIVYIADSNLIEFAIAYPTNFSNDIEIYVCTNLCEDQWSVVTNLSTEGTNYLTWILENASNLPHHRMYSLGDAETDTDGDGLLDAREITWYETDVETNDSDGDTISDYQEVITDCTDPNNPDTNKPTVWFVFPTNGFKHVWLP